MRKTKKLSFLYSQMVFLMLLPIWMELTYYLHPIVIGVIWLLINFLFLFGICLIKQEKIRISKHILHGLILLYSVGLLILLFFRPKGQNYGTINLMPFETINFYLSGNVPVLVAAYNLGANICLFIPFGLYYRLFSKMPSKKQLLIITFITISLIEGLQWITKRGSLDIDDLLLNIIGVFLGYLLYPLFQKVFIYK